ncbi:hypothetical protein KKC_00932 [Listeria fleischmannii subsp. coloradonensis]|nr:hypothetical protein KKC_00932 [Listeria fleischmannii subsp. coloradonensis]
METKLWSIDQGRHIYMEAAELLRQGETVAFPTETVYGLKAGGDCRISYRNSLRAWSRRHE